MTIDQILLWLPMIAIAFSNAALREIVLIKRFSDLRAHQLSTLTLIVFCSIYVWFLFPVLEIKSPRQAILIGLVWSILTIAFEFTLGRITNKSWDYLFRDYNLKEGRIWLLFLLSLSVLPYLVFVFRAV